MWGASIAYFVVQCGGCGFFLPFAYVVSDHVPPSMWHMLVTLRFGGSLEVHDYNSLPFNEIHSHARLKKKTQSCNSII